MHTPYPELPKSTLIIGGWSSSCNNCGKQVLPDSPTHEEVSGYGQPEPGCGIKFTHVTNEYSNHNEVAHAMRPDLTWIPIHAGLAGQ